MESVSIEQLVEQKSSSEQRSKQVDDLQIRLLETGVTEQEEKNRYRFPSAKRFLWVAIGWLIFVGIVTITNAIDAAPFNLSDTVMMSLLGTATANVFTPEYLVAKYLFADNR